jgi:hypothetical protein
MPHPRLLRTGSSAYKGKNQAQQKKANEGAFMFRAFRYSATWRLAIAAAAFFCRVSPAELRAAAPEISKLSLRGLQSGGITTLTIEGKHLLPKPQILLPIPITGQAIKEESPTRVAIEMALPGTVAPGMYPLRIANPKGVSNPVLIGIDSLAQLPFMSRVGSLPAALHGKLPKSDTLRTKFSGKRGQRIVVDLEARRLGSAIDPIVELRDVRQVQIAYGQGHVSLGGDARLEAVLPADGEYTIELHDLLYQAGNPNQFRLKLGELHYADRVFPLGGQRGTAACFEIIGNVPTTARRVKVDLNTAGTNIPVPLPPMPGLTGPLPGIVIDDFPEVTQADSPAHGLREVTVPAIINGRITKPGVEDRYRLLVKPGMKLRVDVLANRAGSPLDAVLFLRKENGTQLAMSDDQPSTVDPGLEFTVPDNVTSLVAALTDLEGHGGKEYIYRLAITPLERPDFSLTLSEDRLLIPQSGTAITPVRASRAHYQGPIKLMIPALPDGVSVSGDEIPAGATETLLSLSAPADASPTQTLTRIIGSANDPNVRIQRLAMLAETATTERQPWLRSEWAVAVTEPGPLRIAWENDAPTMVIGSHYPAKVKVTRADGVPGAVRLSLLTSQAVPKMSDGNQDDPKRALRFEGAPMLAADQTEMTAPIIIPPDLPARAYDVAVRAELLDSDGTRVRATAFTPGRRLQAHQPFALQLDGPAAIADKSGSGPTGKLKGRITRATGFTGPITVTVIGLPAGLKAPTITIPEDRSSFELSVALSYETKLEALLNLKAVATCQVGPQRVVKKSEIPVSIQIIQSESPDS